MKEKFEPASFEVVRFDKDADIITTSGGPTGGCDYGEHNQPSKPWWPWWPWWHW